MLHPFQMLEGPAPPPPAPMFARGRLDHFALLAPSEEAFWRAARAASRPRARRTARCATCAPLWIMGYLDPDGAAHEVILQRPGFADADMLERAAWTTLTPPG